MMYSFKTYVKVDYLANRDSNEITAEGVIVKPFYVEASNLNEASARYVEVLRTEYDINIHSNSARSPEEWFDYINNRYLGRKYYGTAICRTIWPGNEVRRRVLILVEHTEASAASTLKKDWPIYAGIPDTKKTGGCTSKRYTLINGARYSLDKKKLVCVAPDFTGHFDIPSHVTTIAYDAFRGCEGLSGVTIPSTVKYIGNRAFSNCTSLTSVNIPGTVKVMGTEVFSGCTALESVMFGKGFKDIASKTFYGCTALTDVVLPTTLREIGTGAFTMCLSLQSINVPIITRIYDGRIADAHWAVREGSTYKDWRQYTTHAIVHC